MSNGTQSERRTTWRAVCLALCACATICSIARADDAQQRLLVLRNDVAATELSPSIDDALLRSLSKHADFESTYFSPTPFAEIKLAAGCRGRTDACVSRIAASLQADWLLVRELKRDDSGALVLNLVAQDGADAEARRSQARVSELGDEERVRVVDDLVTRLYGEELESAAPVADTGRARDSQRRPMRIAGFSVLAASGAVLAVGIAEGARGKNEHDRYRDTTVIDDRSAQLAHDYLETAQKHTRVANGLFAAGAVAASTGIALLIWDRVRRSSDDRSRLAVGVRANAQGGLLSVRGPLWRSP